MGCNDTTLAPLELTASGADFSYALRLDADRAAGAAGRCRLQPEIASADRPRIITASLFSRWPASIAIDDKPVEVTGQAWMDREWSSQPLASDQTGWDWFSLHLNSGEKLMLYRLRQTDGNNYALRQLDRAGRHVPRRSPRPTSA